MDRTALHGSVEDFDGWTLILYELFAGMNLWIT